MVKEKSYKEKIRELTDIIEDEDILKRVYSLEQRLYIIMASPPKTKKEEQVVGK